MKRKNISIFALALAVGLFAFVPVLVLGNDVLTRDTIKDLIKQGTKDKQDNEKNYLATSALDYFKSNAFIVFDGNRNVYTPMDHPLYKDNDSIQLFMEGRLEQALLQNINFSTLTDQFDIMTYLIYTGRNEDLEYFLNKGWTENIQVEVNLLEGETKTINLFTQIVLSNNKEALQIIRDSIAKKDPASLMMSYQIASRGLIAGTDYDYDNEYLRSRYTYAENNLTAESIAQTVIDGDIITLYDYIDIIQNKYKSKNAELFFDALNLLIDYRIENGY